MLSIAVLMGVGFRDVSRELAGLGTLAPFERADALLARAAHGDLDVVVTGLDDQSGRSIAATLVELAARHPTLPVIVRDRVDGATLPKLLAVAAIGMRLEFAVWPYERLAPIVRRVVSADYRPGVTPVLLQRFVPPAPRHLRVFTALAALVARSRRGVAEVAQWSGVSPRTIERRLHRARVPGAHVVLQSFVALDAVWLMSEYGWSARRVQQVRAFPHASSVTRLLAGYCGMHAGTVREEGGFAAALAHVTHSLSPADRPGDVAGSSDRR